jgi:putative oligomerization/nucleic acid binding protein
MGKAGLKITFLMLLPLSLAIGLFVAGIGTAMWPPVSAWAAPFACGGTIDVQSDHYSTPSGGSGVSRHIYCVSGAGKDAARDEMTFAAIGIAGLVYAAMLFVILQFFVAPRMRRRPEPDMSVTDFGGGVSARGVASAAEMQAILGRVSDALQRGEAGITVHNVTLGEAEEGDVAQRLAILKQLHDAGLVGDDDYEAKKAEILSRL